MGDPGIKPSPRHRRILYLGFGLLWLTGLVVLLLQYWKPTDAMPVTPRWMGWLRLHAAFGFLTMILLGNLISSHIRPAIDAKEKLGSGYALFTTLLVLIVTAYGLYYIGNDHLREGARNIHVWLGAALPVFWWIHRR